MYYSIFLDFRVHFIFNAKCFCRICSQKWKKTWGEKMIAYIFADFSWIEQMIHTIFFETQDQISQEKNKKLAKYQFLSRVRSGG